MEGESEEVFPFSDPTSQPASPQLPPALPKKTRKRHIFSLLNENETEGEVKDDLEASADFVEAGGDRRYYNDPITTNLFIEGLVSAHLWRCLVYWDNCKFRNCMH